MSHYISLWHPVFIRMCCSLSHASEHIFLEGGKGERWPQHNARQQLVLTEAAASSKQAVPLPPSLPAFYLGLNWRVKKW